MPGKCGPCEPNWHTSVILKFSTCPGDQWITNCIGPREFCWSANTSEPLMKGRDKQWRQMGTISREPLISGLRRQEWGGVAGCSISPRHTITALCSLTNILRGISYRDKDVFIAGIQAKKRLDISHKQNNGPANHWKRELHWSSGNFRGDESQEQWTFRALIPIL